MANTVLKELHRAARLEEEQKLFDELVAKVQSPDEISQAISLTASREDLPGALLRALKVVREERRQALLNVICE